MSLAGNLRNLYLWGVLFFLASWSLSCSKTGFVGNNRNNTAKPAPSVSGDSESTVLPPTATPGEIKTQVFELHGPSRSGLDMVWVVDNSGSMKDEIDQVSRNLTRFTESLSHDIDLKFALISATKSGHEMYGLQIPSNFPAQVQRQQVDRYVDSYDGLELAAFASCPSDSSDKSRLCGSEFVVLGTNGQPEYGLAHNIKGTLSSFFRPSTKRIYVFVSDDDSTRMTDAEFQKRITPYLQGSSFVVYAFAGMPGSQCGIVNPGIAYLNLSKNTGGKTYDLCLSDWSQHFSELTAEVRAKVKNEFILTSTPNKILSVKLNEITLNSGEYSLLGNILRVHNRNETTGKLTVVYE